MNKKGARLIIIGLLLFFILFSAYRIWVILHDYQKASNLYEETASKYIKEENNKDSSYNKEENKLEDNDGSQSQESNICSDWKNIISVDLEALQAQNADVIGWLYFENENISYPILFSGDNETYLRTSYTKEKMTAGSIFVEGKNSPDLSDKHTIIYGHNMKNLLMFGRLRFYKENADYYEEHKYFQIITNDKYYRYEIFAYKDVDESSSLYTTQFDSTDTFSRFVSEMLLKGSYLKTDIDVKEEDKIVTLSTCSGEGNRFVVSAVRVGEANRE